MAAHIHQALDQVRVLRRKVLESQWFRGYSGRARAFSGSLALGVAAVMALPGYPKTSRAQFAGWAVVFLVAIATNYGALIRWFLSDPGVKRDSRRLLPTVDPMLPMIVGGVMTLAVCMHGHFDYLFGIWMCMFGLANLSSRWVMPSAVWALGVYYVACGAVCLVVRSIHFLNPWPMGIVFFVGEWTGGFIFYFFKHPNATFWSFFSE